MCLALAGSAAAQVPHSLHFDGSDDYVTFGAAPGLGASVFTVEVRFKRTGTGTTASTGVGGATAIPLLAKGRGEADGDNHDMNYFLGIRGSDNVLAADFEEGTGQTSPGANHPVYGTTPVTSNVWHHAAATFDGTTWRLYLDGNLEATLALGSNRLPQSASIQHASLGTALNSSGTAEGHFQGFLDEARVWNVARSQAQIQASMGAEVLSGSGLLARWGLNEGSGTVAGNSIAGTPNGTLTLGPTWSSDSNVPLATATGLRFGGTNASVTFGDPAALRLGQFTVETWFRRDGAGIATSTGSGGISSVIPLVAKGRNEGESAALDLNYLLGIRTSDNVLAADLEEGLGGVSPSQNHPIFGVTPLANGVWYHAAATYDGNQWQLFLNGELEAELVVARPANAASTQHASIASALNSSGVAAGFFQGALDEPRIWNTARSQAQIQAAMNTPLAGPTTGLVARWGLDEDAGTAVSSSAGITVNGTITGGDWSWAAGSPFDAAPPSPPAAPSGLGATALAQGQIHVSWTDVATNETGYEVERSTTGSGGPFGLVATRPAGSTSYDDSDVAPLAEYCYRVRAVNGTGASSYAGPACATALGPPSFALGSEFDAYVDFGDVPALRLGQFTIEMWLRRDGDGFGTDTGPGGLSNVLPVFTKGRDNAGVNYFFGIRRSDHVLCVDVEEGAGGASPGANHPLYGVTPVAEGPWYHVAATYDGTTLRLYLDGRLDASLAVNQPIATASATPACLMSALDAGGTPDGYFIGPTDEVRVWNVARSQSQILSTINQRISTAQAGLVARWSLDEGTGTVVNGSAGTNVTGTVHGAYYKWQDGAPFNAIADKPPLEPGLDAPADRSLGASTSPNLRVVATDPEGSPMTVTWYGRAITPSGAPDFTLVGLPDTQYLTGELLGGSNAMLRAQTDWIATHRASDNIAYATQYGDCVEHGDYNGNPIEWMRADTAFSALENPITTGLTEGVPYDITVGNHDQSDNGDADGTTDFFNQYFGAARFQGRAYYGGHFGSNYDNHYHLFGAGGLDFLLLSLEYDTSPDPGVLTWADDLLATYSNRRAIVVSHYITNTGNPAAFSHQGQMIYETLRHHPNLFLMLSGHIDGEGRRQDTYNGSTVYTLETNYQWHPNGGEGFMRLMQFSPANNAIRIRSYSPWLDQYKVSPDSASQFTISYDMTSGPAFQMIGSVSGVTSGSIATLPWAGLQAGTTYEWYATATDGTTLTRGPFWRFTTTGPTGVDDERPSALTLARIAPHPMRGHGRIAFAVPAASPVRLSVFDLQGREVARLADGVHQPGRYSVTWDGTGHGGRLQSGVYFVRLQTPDRALVERLVLMH